jgi:hypothetical protein
MVSAPKAVSYIHVLASSSMRKNFNAYITASPTTQMWGTIR